MAALTSSSSAGASDSMLSDVVVLMNVGLSGAPKKSDRPRHIGSSSSTTPTNPSVASASIAAAAIAFGSEMKSSSGIRGSPNRSIRHSRLSVA